jgi:hypothetical protein
MNIRVALEENLKLQDDALYGVLTEILVKAVEYTVEECGGIFQPTDGGWQEWMIKTSVRPKAILGTEREELDEVLAWASVQGNLDSVTPKLLSVLGMS